MRYEVVDVEKQEHSPIPCYAIGSKGKMCTRPARYVRMRYGYVNIFSNAKAWTVTDGFCAGHAPAHVDVKNALRMER